MQKHWTNAGKKAEKTSEERPTAEKTENLTERAARKPLEKTAVNAAAEKRADLPEQTAGRQTAHAAGGMSTKEMAYAKGTVAERSAAKQTASSTERMSEELPEEASGKAADAAKSPSADAGVSALAHGLRLVHIIGQIEGHTLLPPQTKTTKYEHIVPQLVEMEQDAQVRGILLLLNTMGGDVEAGLAIAELIRSMQTPTLSLVLGGGHSIGVPLAVSARYSMIVPTACMTVHPLRTNGLFIASPQSFAYYLKMQERILRFIEENARISKEEIEALMNNKNQMADDVGTVLIGAQAVEAGLIDEVGGLHTALCRLEALCQENG